METKLIAIGLLQNHPNNPRKDFGDVSELADSIKANGVLQNLTVVPHDDKYYVVIGNRRLKAAQQAGLTELPCVISDMPEDQQIQTMLVENIERENMTAYDEAQGFQMMMDLGQSAEQIAENSGFSRATVYRRTRLLNLDKDKFQQASKRGVTFFDLDKISDITDEAKRNEVLEKAGTKDFNFALKSALDEQKKKEAVDKFIDECTKMGITPIKTEGYEFGFSYVDDDDGVRHYLRSIYNQYDASKIKNLNDIEMDLNREHFYTISSYYSVMIYEGVTQEEIQAKNDEHDEKEKYKEAAEALEAQAKELDNRFKELRQEFFEKFTAAKSNKDKVMKYATYLLLNPELLATDNRYNRPEIMKKLFGENDPMEGIETNPFGIALKVIAKLIDNFSMYSTKWNGNAGCYYVVPHDTKESTILYAILQELGYEASEEEAEMIAGSHPIFDTGWMGEFDPNKDKDDVENMENEFNEAEVAQATAEDAVA